MKISEPTLPNNTDLLKAKPTISRFYPYKQSLTCHFDQPAYLIRFQRPSTFAGQTNSGGARLENYSGH